MTGEPDQGRHFLGGLALTLIGAFPSAWTI